MQENELNAKKKIGPDGKPVSFRKPGVTEQVVEDMQWNTNMPRVVENIFISIAVKVGRYTDKEEF